MDEISFEHRLKKAKTGFKRKAEQKSFRDIAEDKEKQLAKVNRGRKKIGAPKEVYSKRRLGDKMLSQGVQKEKPRDPRFEGTEKINKGLFEASYKFVDDMAKQRERDIKQQLKHKKKKMTEEEEKDKDKLISILSEETNWRKKKFRDLNNQNNMYLKKAKEMNKERAKKGLKPIFYKKRELKEMKYKEDFERFDKQGKVDKAISKAFKQL